MIEKNQGIILFLKNIKDNDKFVKLLNKDDELVTGIVYGGNTSKKKSIYQLGYFIEYNIIKKNKNIVPAIDANISEPFISPIINNKFKFYAVLSIISLMNISIIEGQKVRGIYISIKQILEIIIKKKQWISYYCEWLFILLKIIGYEIDYKNHIEFKYFNLYNQTFQNLKKTNEIIFPHKLLIHNSSIKYSDINAIFIIFESIFTKNHLNNTKYIMPYHYKIFKTSILKYLKNNHV